MSLCLQHVQVKYFSCIRAPLNLALLGGLSLHFGTFEVHRCFDLSSLCAGKKDIMCSVEFLTPSGFFYVILTLFPFVSLGVTSLTISLLSEK